MIRTLVIIAVAGFFMATVCFGVVAALGGPAIARGDWDWANRLSSWEDGDYQYDGERVEGSGPETTREMTWAGGDELTVSVPAEIQYTQGPETKLTVTGPAGSVNHVIVDGDRIRFDRRMRNTGRVNIIMTAPSVTEFNLLGSQRLNIDSYDQASLRVSIAGAGKATAKGRATSTEIEIAGSGDVDFGGVVSERAKVEIAGSGDATVGPKESVEIHIAGSGDVKLVTRPPRVEQHFAGSGKITYLDQVAPTTETPAATPAPVAPATPPAAPAPKAPAKGTKT